MLALAKDWTKKEGDNLAVKTQIQGLKLLQIKKWSDD
jgi:hypothetical protein